MIRRRLHGLVPIMDLRGVFRYICIAAYTIPKIDNLMHRHTFFIPKVGGLLEVTASSSLHASGVLVECADELETKIRGATTLELGRHVQNR